MIDITETTDRCYALTALNTCKLLTVQDCRQCNFYKPAGCEDWVRLEQDGKVILLPPEEYEV